MKWMFFYAHPDDESVAAGGTIRKLVDYGDEVFLVLATSGNGGEIKNFSALDIKMDDFKQKSSVEKRKTTKQIRLSELGDACSALGINKSIVLDYEDGRINNEMVWGGLKKSFIKLIRKHKPDALVTFGHMGWYYHMDHIGVSLALKNAFEEIKEKPDVFLFNKFNPPGMRDKWKYNYPESLSPTYKVNICDVLDIKKKAILSHKSQKISLVDDLEQGRLNEEYFKLIFKTKKGKELLSKRGFFEII